MTKTKEFLKRQRQIKWFRIMCWKILSAIISGVGTYVSGLTGPEFVFVVTIGTQAVDRLLKYINTKILKDVGVE